MKSIVDARTPRARRWRFIRMELRGVRDTVRAGADSVEHGADVEDETFAEMARKGVWVPTVDQQSLLHRRAMSSVSRRESKAR
jgi:imidazolonepropionase-like amidohydrolase